MKTQRVPAVNTDALPTICATPTCYKNALRYNPYCSDCLGDQDIERYLHSDDVWVFFVTCRDTVYISATKDVERRFKELQRASPDAIELTFAIKARPALEIELHAMLHDSVKHGKWYELSDEVCEVLLTVKHYGKGFSVEQWEATCDYYIRHWSKYADKWRKRKGKAIHTEYESDFGNKLIRWKDRDKGFSLEDKAYGKN